MCALLQLNQTLGDLLGMRMQHGRVDFHAIALNPRQHRHQRHFDMLKDIQRTFMLLQLRPHLQMQLERDVGIFRRVAASLLQCNLVKGELVLTFTSDLFKGNGFMLQPAVGKTVHIVAARHAVENVGFQHGIERNPAQLNVIVGQNTAIVFEILPDLEQLLILQQRFK